MKTLALSMMLTLSVSALADDEWVSVGGQQAVAPAAATSEPTPSRFSQPAAPATATAVVPSFSSAAAPASAPVNADLVSELFTQIEQMQQEIAQLRSLVEFQGQQLEQMGQAQQNRYLDLDRRVASLISAPAATTAAPLVSDTQAAASADQPSADDAYKQAMTLVREKQFAQAAQAFSQFSQNYPQHSLVANSYYWAGEVYLVQGELEQAEQAFGQVVNRFADHRKAADAHYKLAVTWHKQGKDEQAKAQLQTVIKDFAQRSPATARLAKAYLDKISG